MMVQEILIVEDNASHRVAAEKVLHIFSLSYLEEISPYRNIADKERLMNALRKAGLGNKNGRIGK